MCLSSKTDGRSCCRLKKHKNGLTAYRELDEKIGSLDKQIEPVQRKYDHALELVGIKQVRSACSSRVSSNVWAEQKGIEWGVSKESVSNKESAQNEQTEVSKLKEEMLEMKKILKEQADLIKTLTAKS